MTSRTIFSLFVLAAFAVPLWSVDSVLISEEIRNPGLYSNFKTLTSVNPVRPVDLCAAQLILGRPMGAGRPVSPVPWILPPAEWRKIRRGVHQRGRALALFFEDLVLGDQNCFKEGGFISAEEVTRFLKQDGHSLPNLRSLWKRNGSKNISFFYNPRLIRSASGEFVILDDHVDANDGFLSVEVVHRAFVRALQLSPAQEFPYVSPDGTFDRLVHFFLRRNDLSVEDTWGLVDHGERILNWNFAREAGEHGLGDFWRTTYLKRIGIEPLETFDGFVEGRPLRKFLRKNPRRALIQSSSHGFQEIFFRGVQFIHAPGTEFLGSRAFFPFVEAMIRFYLPDEEVKLPSVASENFYLKYNSKEAAHRWSQYVRRPTRIDPSRSENLSYFTSEGLVTPEPGFWETSARQISEGGHDPRDFRISVQERPKPTRIGELAVHLRPLVLVSGGSAVVGDVPAGYAYSDNPVDAFTSDGGMNLVVLVPTAD